jgi:RNA polymerase sigma-70 factor (ECF subfamily)
MWYSARMLRELDRVRSPTKPLPVTRRVVTVEAAVWSMSEVHEVAVVDTLDSLFRAHYGRLVRALTLACGSQEVAADAVQEAFVKAHLRWKRLQHYEDPVGWIRRVAINNLRDVHRRDTRKDKAMSRMAALPPPVIASTDELAPDLAPILSQLPRQQRFAVALFYVDGMSVAEVAEVLQISEGAVKFHLHQGRARLRGAVSTGDIR